MTYDIVIVTYNSAGWLPPCVAALAQSDYDHRELHLIFADNASGDDTLQVLERLQQEYSGHFGAFTVLPQGGNFGFSRGCNAGAKADDAPFLFFLNADTCVSTDVFTALARAAAEFSDAGAYECRQLPYEMGHHVDPVTLQTPWASGAALIVRREVFWQAGGFDEHLFMYCEDVDLSWRIRAAGYSIVYVPGAVVNHYVLERPDTAASELREYAGTALGRLLLSYKYEGPGGIWRANRRYLHEMRHPRHFDGVRRLFAKNYLRHLAKLWPFLFWRLGHRALYKKAPAVLDKAEFAPERGRYVLKQRLTAGPLISVVVRTHKRPQVLRGALTSLLHQTYSHFEVIVVEDGAETSRAMVEQKFSALPVRYYTTGKNVGRGKTGNYGLAQAKGDYLSFLDDDDYVYPDHLELMAAEAQKHPDADLILGCAMAMKIEVESREPYRYAIKDLHTMHFDRLDLFTMCQTCQIPIQSAIFKKELYARCGGLQEDIEGNEDWAMWLRFLRVAKRANPRHVDIDRATSIFVLPASREEEEKRLEKYRTYDKQFFADESMRFEVSLAQMRQFYDDMIADVRHVQNKGELEAYLAQNAKRNEE